MDNGRTVRIFGPNSVTSQIARGDLLVNDKKEYHFFDGVGFVPATATQFNFVTVPKIFDPFRDEINVWERDRSWWQEHDFHGLPPIHRALQADLSPYAAEIERNYGRDTPDHFWRSHFTHPVFGRIDTMNNDGDLESLRENRWQCHIWPFLSVEKETVAAKVIQWRIIKGFAYDQAPKKYWKLHRNPSTTDQ